MTYTSVKTTADWLHYFHQPASALHCLQMEAGLEVAVVVVTTDTSIAIDSIIVEDWVAGITGEPIVGISVTAACIVTA